MIACLCTFLSVLGLFKRGWRVKQDESVIVGISPSAALLSPNSCTAYFRSRQVGPE